MYGHLAAVLFPGAGFFETFFAMRASTAFFGIVFGATFFWLPSAVGFFETVLGARVPSVFFGIAFDVVFFCLF
jgi:hypothetical protein